MSDFCEVKIKVSNEEQKFSQKFPCYEKVCINKDDPVLAKMVEETLNSFRGNVDEVKVIVTYNWN